MAVRSRGVVEMMTLRGAASRRGSSGTQEPAGTRRPRRAAGRGGGRAGQRGHHDSGGREASVQRLCCAASAPQLHHLTWKNCGHRARAHLPRDPKKCPSHHLSPWPGTGSHTTDCGPSGGGGTRTRPIRVTPPPHSGAAQGSCVAARRGAAAAGGLPGSRAA
jgi:hypothetical protein